MPGFRRRYRFVCPRPLPPPYWRRIHPGSALLTSGRIREWTLVLSACGIYWQLCRIGKRHAIYVSPLLEKTANQEIIAYIRDNAPQLATGRTWPLNKSWPLAPLYLLPLIFCFGFQQKMFQIPAWWQTQSDFVALGSLDNIRLFLHHEWWRLETALLLHSGWPHLIGNLFFGSIFLILLARLIGAGRAWLLTALGGIIGNLLSALAHTLNYASIGFSTALFACVGATGGILLLRRQGGLPVAAALGFLALLGTEGAHTDYMAHLCGFGAGTGLGILDGVFDRKNWPQLPQWPAAILALVLPFLAWVIAWRSI